MLTPLDGPVYVAGHRGLAGSAIWSQLDTDGGPELVGRTSSELDLRDRAAVDRFFDEVRPAAVILAAARVGGISANATFPIDYLSENLQIQLNVLDAARRTEVADLVFIASSAAYPHTAQSPIAESALMTGPPEPAHAGYALAKLAGVQYVHLMRESGARWSALLPTNIYGPHDNFHAEWSHVVPALLRRFHEAVQAGTDEITIWGTGNAQREFLYSDDLAALCIQLLGRDDAPAVLNIGSGEEVTIARLVELIAEVTGFSGSIGFDTSRPDGVARRSLDSSRARDLGWVPRIDLAAGLRTTYDWFAERWPEGVRH